MNILLRLSEPLWVDADSVETDFGFVDYAPCFVLSSGTWFLVYVIVIWFERVRVLIEDTYFPFTVDTLHSRRPKPDQLRIGIQFNIMPRLQVQMPHIFSSFAQSFKLLFDFTYFVIDLLKMLLIPSMLLQICEAATACLLLRPRNCFYGVLYTMIEEINFFVNVVLDEILRTCMTSAIHTLTLMKIFIIHCFDIIVGVSIKFEWLFCSDSFMNGDPIVSLLFLVLRQPIV